MRGVWTGCSAGENIHFAADSVRLLRWETGDRVGCRIRETANGASGTARTYGTGVVRVDAHRAKASDLWVWGDWRHLLLPIGHLLLPKTAKWMPNRPRKGTPKRVFGNAPPPLVRSEVPCRPHGFSRVELQRNGMERLSILSVEIERMWRRACRNGAPRRSRRDSRPGSYAQAGRMPCSSSLFGQVSKKDTCILPCRFGKISLS